MPDGAYAQIFGTLTEDINIDIGVNGKKYGILSVITKSKFKSYRNVSKSTSLFKVFIWDQTTLHDQVESFRKGKKILIIGELRTVGEAALWYGVPCQAIIIEINYLFRVNVL